MGERITESTVEEAALAWFEGLGYAVLNGPEIAPGELYSERASYADVVLVGRPPLSPLPFMVNHPGRGV